MDTSCRLVVIAWLYVLVGVQASIEEVVSLFRPVESETELLCVIPGFNFLVFAPLIGFGLMKRKELARRIAVGLGWLMLIPVSIALVALVFAVIFFQVQWKAHERPIQGEDISRGIMGLVVYIPLFLWQFRELRSSDVRDLTAPRVVAAETPDVSARS